MLIRWHAKTKPENRIASLKDFIADQENRLENHKVLQTIRAKIEEAKKTVEALEASEAKRRKEQETEAVKVAADRKRKDDQHAKILMGAGLDLLKPVEEAARIRAKILPMLSQRDRDWYMGYASKYTVALSADGELEPSLCVETAPSPLLEPTSAVASALMRALDQLDPMLLEHIGGELLSSVDGADRSVLEVHLAALGQRFSS